MQNLETIPKLWENGMTSDVRAVGHLSLEIDLHKFHRPENSWKFVIIKMIVSTGWLDDQINISSSHAR